MKAGPAVVVRSLTKNFRARAGHLVNALSSVDLDIYSGEFVTLVGRSGCGKSTLLNLVGGLLEPSTGTIQVRGEKMRGPRSDIGYMQQDAIMLPWRTILKNILLPLEVGNRDRDLSKERVMSRSHELLELVGLTAFQDSYPRELSGGMNQRASLVRMLTYDPRLLLMDEPFGSLDEFTRETMNRELLKLWQGSDVTVLFVTHNISEAVFLSDRVVVMSQRPGRIDGVLEIRLSRPRKPEVLFSPPFADYVRTIRQMLGVEVAEDGG